VQCPSCKAKIPEGSKFCLECGAVLFGRCPSCGKANPASAKFCFECGYKLPATRLDAAGSAATDTATPQTSQLAGSPERRQLTVLFCDLVGSTALSVRLDPEDMRDIMSAYHHRCAEVIGKSDGFVAKYMGDGVLAYFGYPQAHEDDAERAVRCGLALVEAACRLQASHGTALQMRVGIATGVVVVGDLIGEGVAQEQGVIGETPNLAARLQTIAEPGQVASKQVDCRRGDRACHCARQGIYKAELDVALCALREMAFPSSLNAGGKEVLSRQATPKPSSNDPACSYYLLRWRTRAACGP